MATGATVRDVTHDLMRQLGLTTVFGNPGSTEIGFLADWPDDFRYVLGLQESVAVAMADGHAQAGGQAVLVNLHSAGGVGHALGSVFTAYRNRTPMIVLAGQQARPLLNGEPFLGASDATLFPKPYVKWAVEPARAAEVPAALARAYHLATQPPRGPVFVSVPADDWDQPAAPLPARRPIRGFGPHPDALRELAEALEGSRAPALIAGPAVDLDGAVEDLVTLAERTRAAVWVPPLSPRCSFPEDHPLFAGFLQPEQRALAAALAPHDLAVVLGAPAFTFHVFRGRAEQPLPDMFVVSDDPDELARAVEGQGVRSTVGLAIRQLVETVPPATRPAPAPLRRPPAPAPARPITAAYALHTLAEVLPADGIVVEEIPSHRNDLHDFLPIRARGGGFLTMASGALGYSLPAAVGVAMARPDRTVVALAGDGSSMYGIQALWTAARERTRVTFVILDNSGYAAVRVLADSLGIAKLPGVELGGIDFTAVAGGLGCAGVRVDDPGQLKPALAEAIAEPGPTLVHVLVDPTPRKLY